MWHSDTAEQAPVSCVCAPTGEEEPAAAGLVGPSFSSAQYPGAPHSHRPPGFSTKIVRAQAKEGMQVASKLPSLESLFSLIACL